MLYFAYGSNMDPSQMSERCPDTQFVGIASLADYTLSFPRQSKKRGCGVASIERQVSSVTWGPVYRLSASDIVALDKSEGFKATRAAEENSYNRINIVVNLAGVPTTVQTYLANPQDGVHLPSEAYLKHLRHGARHHGLPAEYQAKLELIPYQ